MKRWPYDKFAKHRWWRQLRAHSMMMVRNSLNSLGLFQTRPKKMVDKPYSRTYTQPRAVYCQNLPGLQSSPGSRWCRTSSSVLHGGVRWLWCCGDQKLRRKRCSGARKGDVFFCQDSCGKIFWVSVFLVGEKHLELERKRTLRGLSELDCKGMNDFAACCEGLRFSQLVSAFSRIADD